MWRWKIAAPGKRRDNEAGKSPSRTIRPRPRRQTPTPQESPTLLPVGRVDEWENPRGLVSPCSPPRVSGRERVSAAVSALLELGPFCPPRCAQNQAWSRAIPEGHLEHLALVDVLAPVVVAVQHLPEERVIEFGVRLQALGALADVGQHEARLAVGGQLVLLHAPVGTTSHVRGTLNLTLTLTLTLT